MYVDCDRLLTFADLSSQHRSKVYFMLISHIQYVGHQYRLSISICHSYMNIEAVGTSVSAYTPCLNMQSILQVQETTQQSQRLRPSMLALYTNHLYNYNIFECTHFWGECVDYAGQAATRHTRAEFTCP